MKTTRTLCSTLLLASLTGPRMIFANFRSGVWIVLLSLGGLFCCGAFAGEGSGMSPNKDGGTSSRNAMAEVLYTQVGTDPSFKSLRDAGLIPVGRNSTRGVKGSTIRVNKAEVERGANAQNPIPNDIAIHTLCNSMIPRKDFGKWTRWYQEDGHTQVFRLFKGETNVRNTRALAARVEAFSRLHWQRGEWHEWVGTYTIIKPHGCAIFQVKNNKNDWAVQLNLTDDGNIVLNHRRNQQDIVIARNMTGKSFDLKVRDNGHDYEVYLNGQKAGAGSYSRPEGQSGFRWGMYLGHSEERHDAMIFVTGAMFK
jgi:hypothetical protein